jgi:hypothetical protein
MRAAEFTLRFKLRAKFYLVCPFLTISTPYICRGPFLRFPRPSFTRGAYGSRYPSGLISRVHSGPSGRFETSRQSMDSMKPTVRNGMVQFVGIALLICFWAMGNSASRNRLCLRAPTRVGRGVELQQRGAKDTEAQCIFYPRRTLAQNAPGHPFGQTPAARQSPRATLSLAALATRDYVGSGSSFCPVCRSVVIVSLCSG